jgi:hypothetical protein
LTRHIAGGALLAGGESSGWARLIDQFTPPDLSCNGIGKHRAAIVVWNAVLPFLAAVGDACGNPALSRMARQGLHHLHTQWCRAKICPACPLRHAHEV